MRILSPHDVTRPQGIYTSVGQDTHKHNLFLDTYTGLLQVNHDAGDEPTEQAIEFPLVYIQEPETDIRIDHWRDPAVRPDEFRAAAVNCSIAGFVDKTDPAIVHILAARADLREVTLNPSGKKIFTVVLAARVKAQNSEFVSVGYHLTVLRRHPPKESLLPGFTAGGADWDGSYAHVSQVIRHGAPQNS